MKVNLIPISIPVFQWIHDTKHISAVLWYLTFKINI